MKILIVEDDPVIVQTLQMLFAGYARTVDVAGDGEVGLRMVETSDYDLILLDVFLPQLDGISVCRQLRAKGWQNPILLLAGEGENSQKEIALKAGADDCVIKPFDADNFMARVRGLLRHEGTTRSPVLTWGQLSIDPSRCQVVYGTQCLSLTPKESAILELFLRHPQQVLSAKAILDRVWTAVEFSSEEAVRGHIKKLRQKFTAVGAPKDLIETKLRVGYQLNPLYSSSLMANEADPMPTLQWVEPNATNEELRIALEQLRSTRAELERKNQQFQAALQEREQCEQRLRLFVRYAPVDGAMFDRDMNYIAVSQHWVDTYQLGSIEAILGNSHYEVVPNIPDRWRQVHRRCLAGASERCDEDYFPLSDGSLIWLRWEVRPWWTATGDVGGILIFAEDITDRKQAEGKIHEQAALLDIASDAISIRDLENRILYWNRGAERLYGWQATEAIGRKANELLQNPDSPSETVVPGLLERGEWRGEMCNLTKSGTTVTVAARWTLVRDDAHRPQSILAVDTDVTEKKQLEAQFYQAQRLESLGTLASGIAHDLNNILAPILMLSQVMSGRQPPLDDRSQKRLKMIEEASKRGTKLVKQILTFVRGSQVERVILSVAPQIQEAMEVLQQTFPKSIEIRQCLPDSPLWQVCADPTHLHQVLVNLCINARDAMPHGGVLTLSAENYVADALVARQNLDARVGNYVLVIISDTGTGISPNTRDRIFEPFFTTKDSSQGTGLGLSTVLGIVKSYGGFLQVSSKMKRGTQFKVFLPAIDADDSTDIDRLKQKFDGDGELVSSVDDDLAV